MKKSINKLAWSTMFFMLLLTVPTRAQSLFKDLIPGPHPASSTPDGYMKVGGDMYFVTAVIAGGPYNNQLWKSDGTPAGTVLVKDSLTITNIAHPIVLRADVNGTLFFTMIDDPGCSICAPELWKSDGTTAGTVLVTTLDYVSYWGGGVGLPPNNFVASGDKLFFNFGRDNGRELWVSDGTAAGTVELLDIFPGSSFGQQNSGVADLPMTAYNGKVYFQGLTAYGNEELYVSDGTAGGTTLFKEINPSSFGGSAPEQWYTYNNELYFLADDGSAGGLWKTDGTVAGTVSVKTGVGFTMPTLFQNELYFGSSGYSLWKTDGTTAGTVLVKDSVGNPRGANNDFIFTHYWKTFPTPPYYEDVLWKSDGTTAGTTPTTFDIGMSSSYAVIGNNMYMTRLDSGNTANVGVWVTDGTATGTTKLLAGFGTGNVFIYNNTVFFTNYETATGYELWTIGGQAGITESETELEGVRLFPNPTNGLLTIQVPDGAVYNGIEVFSLQGELILNESGNSVDLSGKPKGIYIAKIQVDNRIVSAKIVLQ